MVMYKIDRRGGGGAGAAVQKSFTRTDSLAEALWNMSEQNHVSLRF